MKLSQDQGQLMKTEGLEAYCAIDLAGHICETSPNLHVLLDAYANLMGDTCEHLMGADSYAYLMQQLSVHGDVFDLPIYIYPQGTQEMKLLYVSGRRTESSNGQLIGSELYFSEHTYLDDADNPSVASTVKISIHGSVMSANSEAQTWLDHWREDYGYAVPERILHEALLSWAYQDEIVLSESALQASTLNHASPNDAILFTFTPDRQAGVVSISMQPVTSQSVAPQSGAAESNLVTPFQPVFALDSEQTLALHVQAAAEEACLA